MEMSSTLGILVELPGGLQTVSDIELSLREITYHVTLREGWNSHDEHTEAVSPVDLGLIAVLK